MKDVKNGSKHHYPYHSRNHSSCSKLVTVLNILVPYTLSSTHRGKSKELNCNFG